MNLRSAIIQAIVLNPHEIEEEREKVEINAPIETLTPRECEVLRWAITSMLNKQIA